MPGKTKPQPKEILPRSKQTRGADFHQYPLRIDIDLWRRIIAAGTAHGELKTFINDAIREKLDREGK